MWWYDTLTYYYVVNDIIMYITYITWLHRGMYLMTYVPYKHAKTTDRTCVNGQVFVRSWNVTEIRKITLQA